jgi:hypothetical protein
MKSIFNYLERTHQRTSAFCRVFARLLLSMQRSDASPCAQSFCLPLSMSEQRNFLPNTASSSGLRLLAVSVVVRVGALV